jgi:hypothetical protein
MKPRRAELYVRLLTADPPVCGYGSARGLLNACERRRRGQRCLCRFNASEIADDLEAVAVDGDIGGLEIEYEPDEVGDLLADMQLAVGRVTPADDRERDARDRLLQVVSALEIVVERGSGLTDRYSDDIEP